MAADASASLIRVDVLAVAPETTSALITAGAALAGVLAGGLVTAGTTAYFERARQLGDVRQALRLVAEEVRTIWNHCDDLVTEERFPIVHPPSRTFLPSEQWESNRAVLARHLDDTSWNALSPFMDSVPAARALVEVAPLDSPIPSSTLERFDDMRGLAAAIYSALSGGESVDANAEPPPPPRWWRRRKRRA